MEQITLSSAVRRNLLTMQGTANMMAQTQNRLATGKRVNSAIDNPTNFFTASALNSRSSDLMRLQDSVGNAVQTIEAADNGIKAITKLVESAQGTARQALQASKDVTNASANGTVPNYVVATGGGNIDISVNGGTAVNVALIATDTAADAATKINAASAGVTASVDTDGHLNIVANGDTDTLQLTDGGGTVNIATAFGLATTSLTSTVNNSSATRATLETEFNELLVQIDQLTKDASFNGNNFLAGDDLKVIFNETGTSSLTVKGVDTSSSGLGLSAAATADFQKNGNIDTVLKSLDSAVTTLRSNASTFGSNLSTVQARKDFTSNMINTLETGAANLTLADINKEGANMLALQTRQQLSTTALSMASQADQAVLRLF